MKGSFLNINKTRNCLLEEIKRNYLMSEKHKKVCRVLNYFEHFLIFVSAISVCVSIFAFAALHSCWPCRYCEFYGRIKNLCINCRN